jgi:hypothetical protein
VSEIWGEDFMRVVLALCVTAAAIAAMASVGSALTKYPSGQPGDIYTCHVSGACEFEGQVVPPHSKPTLPLRVGATPLRENTSKYWWVVQCGGGQEKHCYYWGYSAISATTPISQMLNARDPWGINLTVIAFAKRVSGTTRWNIYRRGVSAPVAYATPKSGTWRIYRIVTPKYSRYAGYVNVGPTFGGVAGLAWLRVQAY